MIRALLQTNPDLRPSCDKILKTPIIQKKLRNNSIEESEKAMLLRTIKANDNFYSIVDQLPKANYLPVKVKKAKGIKSLIDSLEGK